VPGRTEREFRHVERSHFECTGLLQTSGRRRDLSGSLIEYGLRSVTHQTATTPEHVFVGERYALQSTHGYNPTTTGIRQHEIGALSPEQQGLGLDCQETIRPLLRTTGTLECL
jgi:hypothetical protein